MNRLLHDKGSKLSQGTIVDAPSLGAPFSTKSRDKARDPEMHQIKKGNQWYFGMKARHEPDAQRGDNGGESGRSDQVGDLSHDKEKVVFGDASYSGAEKHPPARRGRKWHIAAKRS